MTASRAGTGAERPAAEAPAGLGEVVVPARPAVPGRWLPLAATLASTALVLAPLLRPGYVLTYDMVFVPDPALKAETIGLGSQLPRAVPSDAVVGALSHVLPGDVVQKLVLAGLLIGAGTGAARLCGRSPVARTAAALLYLWTPFVSERLLLGQWVVLVAWAVLPWALGAALACRRLRAGALPATVLAVGAAGVGGAPAVLLVAPPVLLVLARRQTRREFLVVLLAVLVVSSVWALPAVLRPGGLAADPRGATVFAPRADTPFGTLLSLLGGGAVWNADAVPALRDGVLPGLGALVLLVLGLVGVVRARDAVPTRFAVMAVGYAAVAGLTVWSAGARFVGRLPGGALARDSSRLVLPLILVAAVGFGVTVELAVAAARRHAPPAAGAVAMLAVLPVAVLPSVAWGVSGRLHTTHVPADYARVDRLLDADARPGAVFVLPATPYRAFGWNGDRPVLDPLPRLLHRPTVLTADLTVRDHGAEVTVRGEDRLARRLAVAAERGSLAPTAAAAGVRFVVADAPVAATDVHGLRPRYAGPRLRLWEVPGVSATRARDPFGPYAPPSAPVVVADLLALAVLLAAAGWVAVPLVRGVVGGRAVRPSVDGAGAGR